MPLTQKYASVKLASARVAQPSEHSHQPVRSGALTVLITIVTLSLAVLSLLALTTARSDLALANRFAQRAEQTAFVESKAQEWLAQVTAAAAELNGLNTEQAQKLLPSGTTLTKKGLAQAEIEGSGVRISAAVQLDFEKNSCEVVRWALTKDWEADEQLNVWDGE